MRMTDPRPPGIQETFQPNLSDDELKLIAKIGLHWAAAEHFVGQATAKFYGVGGEAAKHLIFSREISETIRMLNKQRKAGLIDQAVHGLIDELNYCAEHFRHGRNVYAHGITLTGEDGSRRVVSLAGREANPDELGMDFERAKYVFIIALRLLGFTLGNDLLKLGPLPQRPPAQQP